MKSKRGMEVTAAPVTEPPLETPVPEAAFAMPVFDLQKVLRSPGFVPGALSVLGLLAAFWPLVSGLPKLWMSEDGYYSHGFLVPVIAGYVVYRWWPRLQSRPIRPFWPAILPVLLMLWPLRAAYIQDIEALMSFGLILSLLCGVWFVAGARWMFALSLPILYLAFALPIWTMAIDVYLNRLQIWSTDVAYAMLKSFGLSPFRVDVTTIELNRFTLNVAVPCSGLKLVLALTAFTAFFMMIARLRWWGNLLMAGMVIPLALFINGLRIALIGVVGNEFGTDAGMAFHDYSGYITLLLCFFLLFKFARMLGWKD
ncbi:MAG: exosortase/archaeosortase family protein [Fimbriimonadaceae bacterium]|nr:exosortase/archaeosortase family protein [Fimbriimonadaceae bacterium]